VDFYNPEANVIIDFKTSSSLKGDILDRYTDQLSMYCLMIEEMTGTSPTPLVLHITEKDTSFVVIEKKELK